MNILQHVNVIHKEMKFVIKLMEPVYVKLDILRIAKTNACHAPAIQGQQKTITILVRME